MSNKRLLTLVCSVGLVLILVLVSLMAACAKPAPTPTPTPTPKPTPTPAPTPELPKFRLKYSGYMAPTHMLEEAVRDLGSRVTERTGGKVTFDYYSGASLIKVEETLQGVKSGICDMGDVNLMYYPSMLPLSSVVLVPYLTMDPYAESKAMIELSSTWQPLKDEYAQYDNVGLFFLFGEPTFFFTKKIVKSMADLEGLKIRATSWGCNVMESWGVSPIAMSASDIYTSIERGTIDGICNWAWRAVDPFHSYEVAQYMMNPGMGIYTGHFITINKKVWDDMPQQYRDIMTEEARAIEAALMERTNKKNDDTTSKLAEYMKPVVWTPAEVAKLKNAAVPDVWDAWIEKVSTINPNAKEMLERYEELCGKYAPETTYKDCFDMMLEKAGECTE